MVTDLDELLAAIAENRAVTPRPAKKKPPKKRRKKKPPKKRTSKRYYPRPVGKLKAQLKRERRADPDLARRHAGRWGGLRAVELGLPARKDAAVLAMADDGLTWKQIQRITSMCESDVARALRRARARRAATPAHEGGQDQDDDGS